MKVLNFCRITCNTVLVVYLSTSLALAGSPPVQSPWSTGANHSPQTPTMARTLWAYIPDQPSSKVIQCTVNPTSGKFSHCSDTGANNLNRPYGMVLKAAGTRAFILVNIDDEGEKANVATCAVNPSTGAFSHCKQTGATKILLPGSVTLSPTNA